MGEQVMISIMKNYNLVMGEFDEERIMTFQEMVDITKMPPDFLKRAIVVLAKEHFLVERMHTRIADGILKIQELDGDKEKKRDSKEMDMEDKENIGNDLSETEDIKVSEKLISLEEMVLLTGKHPLYLEKCLVNLALEYLPDD